MSKIVIINMVIKCCVHGCTSNCKSMESEVPFESDK